VISNASVWDTLKLLPDGALPQSYAQEKANTPECDSFMHLHLGIDATNFSRSKKELKAFIYSSKELNNCQN
jgi:hypothetical protein